MTFDDTFHTYRKMANGIRVVPHSGKWAGYYKIGSEWQLVLTGICEGSPPGILAIPIRTFETLQK